MTRERVAILGTGMMGPRIGVCLALAGHPVSVWGRAVDSVERGRAAFDDALEALQGGRLINGRSAQAARKRFSSSTELATAVADAAFAFESVTEDLALKQHLFKEVEAHVAPQTILASNTSGLPITQIAAGLKHPQRVATTHFWNPPHLMPLVEIVKGELTSDHTLQMLRVLLTDAGKRVVVVNKDIPGQLGNRLQHALFREAFHLLEEGVASVEDIDTAIKYGPGLRFPAYGLLEHADMVGLDMMVAIESYLFAALSASTDAPKILTDLIAEGALGVKSGRGLYDWTTQRCAADVLQARDKFVLERIRETRTR